MLFALPLGATIKTQTATDREDEGSALRDELAARQGRCGPDDPGIVGDLVRLTVLVDEMDRPAGAEALYIQG